MLNFIKKHRVLTAVVLVLAAAILLLPSFVSKPYILHIFIMTFYIGSASMAWSVLGSITGQNSMGHASFMAIGAYTASILLTKFGVNPWLGLPIAVLLTGGVSTLLFYPCFGLRGPYFTLATMAFAEAIRNLFINWQWIGGAQGVSLPFGEDSFLLMRYVSKVPYYYIAFGMLIIISIIVLALDRSRLGYALKTVREDEDTANSIGINPQKYKAIALCISTMLMAVTGVFYSQYLRYIDPDIMLSTYSVEYVLPAVVGGMGFAAGPLLGAMLLVPLTELLRSTLSSIMPGINIIVYALVLIIIIRVQPKGILGWYQNRQIKKHHEAAIKALQQKSGKEAGK